MIYCIQCWAGTNRLVPDWSVADEIIAYIESQSQTGKNRTLISEEHPPSRYLWDEQGDGIEYPGVQFILRYTVRGNSNQVWSYVTSKLEQGFTDGTLLGYIVRRHDCNHDNHAVPEGAIEEVVRP